MEGSATPPFPAPWLGKDYIFFSAKISNSNRGKRSLNMLLPIAWFNLKKILSPYFFKEKWLFQGKWLSSFKGIERKRKPKLFTMSNPARFIEKGQKNLKVSH